MIAVALCAFSFPACDEYDDTELWNAVHDLQERLSALEQWQAETNNNIAALQTLLNTHDMITDVTPVTMGDEVIGYTISFLHSDPITIYHGEKGDKGEMGDTPQIGLTQGEDGNWYWTLNGELMQDADGNPIRANGEDGKDGQDGADGEDGEDGATGPAGPQGKPGTSIPPQIKLGKDVTGTIADGGTAIEDAWYLSVDGGSTWYRVSGSDGTSGKNIFDEVKIEGDYVIFTFTDGSSFKVPCGGCTIDEQGNYTVYSAAGLQAWATAVATNAGTNCTLAADITLPTPEEGGSNWVTIRNLIGTFDGAGHTISGLVINSSSTSAPQGFISSLYYGGTVKNLMIKDASISSGYCAGGIVANLSNGSIIGCCFSGTVNGDGSSGGIAGEIFQGSSIIGCYSTASVSGNGAGIAVGGRYNGSTITACYYSGSGNGIGSDLAGSGGTTTQVIDGVTWETAAEEMNKHLTGYQWVENNGEDKESRPLILQKTTL